MTTTPATQSLLPCPFDGGEAICFRVDRGQVTTYRAYCRTCSARTDDASTASEAIGWWNTRSQAPSLPGDVGTDALRDALRPFANAAKWWKAFDNQHRITTLHQHGDCLEVGHLRAAAAALTPSPCPGDVGTGKFAIGDRVSKKSGANWNGRVVGFYSTALTPIGYAVESDREIGSVQIYPEAALTPSALSGDAGEGE